jgi:hypothetical protein
MVVWMGFEEALTCSFTLCGYSHVVLPNDNYEKIVTSDFRVVHHNDPVHDQKIAETLPIRRNAPDPVYSSCDRT